MRFYNLLFVGLMQIADKTIYKGISEYVAAWGLALILELNFIVIIGLTTLGPPILKPYILIPLFGAMAFLNLKYYNLSKLKLDKLSLELSDKFRPNMTSGEILGILMIIEALTIPAIAAVSR